MSLYKKLVELKIAALTGRVPYPHEGICTNLPGEPLAVFRLAKDWPEHSGNKYYPVPSPDSVYDPGYFFIISSDLWDISTVYGRSRMRLLDYLINKAYQLENNP